MAGAGCPSRGRGGGDGWLGAGAARWSGPVAAWAGEARGVGGGRRDTAEDCGTVARVIARVCIPRGRGLPGMWPQDTGRKWGRGREEKAAREGTRRGRASQNAAWGRLGGNEGLGVWLCSQEVRRSREEREEPGGPRVSGGGGRTPTVSEALRMLCSCLHGRQFLLRSQRSEPLLWDSSARLPPKNEGDKRN